LATLDELADLRAATGSDVEIRLAPFIPQMSIDAIDIGSRRLDRPAAS
jgi:hypothetical protein